MGIEIMVCVINSIVSLTIGALSLLGSIWIAYYNIKKAIKNFKKQETFKIKKDAIYETLEFLDNYISWMELEENGRKFEAIPKKGINTYELTLKARECYNKLCTACDNKYLIDIFVELVLTKSKNKVELFGKFRNEAREELGLKKIDLSRDKVFIVEVSAAKLKESGKEG